MDIRFVTKCPYCKTETKQLVEMKHSCHLRTIAYCDPEDGGCDKPFVVTVGLAPTVQVFALVEATQ